MNVDTLEKKPTSPFNPEDPLCDLKSEFTKIFYDCNLDSFAEASEVGFYDVQKPSNEPITNGNGEKKEEFETGQLVAKPGQKTSTPQNSSIKRLDLSPAVFFNSDVSFTTSHDNNAGSKQNFVPIGLEVIKTPEQGGGFGLAHLKEYFQSQEYMNSYADDPLSLIWSNEPPKLGNSHKNEAPQSSQAKKIKQEESSLDYLQMPKSFDYDENYGYDYSSLENSNDYYSKSDKDFSKSLLMRKESHPSIFDHDLISHFERNDVKTSASEKASLVKRNSWAPSSRKRSDSYQDDDDRFDTSLDGKNRSSRGLRVLSLKVKDIVSEKKRTSYKEVAECLIHELGQKFNEKIPGESKDEQNVKRRVYDALNVLIASDILKKDGKAVYCDDKVANIGAHKRRKMKEDKERCEKQMFEIKKRRKDKIETLETLVYKCLAIKHLIKSNQLRDEPSTHNKEPEANMTYEDMLGQKSPNGAQTNATRIGVAKHNPTFDSKNEDVIQFPFIVLVSSAPENSMNLNMDTGQKKLSIESSSPFHIYGDIDVLLKLGLHNVNQEFFKENIPKQIEKYLPKTYLEDLK